MGFFATLFWYWVYASAFVTIFLVLDPVLESIASIRYLYQSFKIYVFASGGGLGIAPAVRVVVVAMLSVLLLEMRRLYPSTALPGFLRRRGVRSRTARVLDFGAVTGSINEVRRRILQQRGRFPPLDAFALLDAPTLRPYHRFSDSALYNSNLLGLVRPSYNRADKEHGSVEFFAEVDCLVGAMGLPAPTLSAPLPISYQRHPRLIHSHPYMAHRQSLPHVTEMHYLHHERMQAITPVHNSLHHEQRILIKYLIFILGRLDEAASHGDLERCILCLTLIDNVSTSFRGLCEVEYSIREEAHRAGFFNSP